MQNPGNHQLYQKFIKILTRLGPYLALFSLVVLAFSYVQLSKTNVSATKKEIAELKSAAKVDKRPEVAEKLDNELILNPNPKVWELNNMKEKLGLTYIDSVSPNKDTK